MAEKIKIKLAKRSQVTIFIIIGIIIIAVIISFFLVYYKTEIGISQPSINEPQQYIEKCARDAAFESIEIMLPQGGYIEPTNYKLYENTKVAYLCYTNLFYTKCTSQEPMYIDHLQDELTNYINPKVEQCFQDLKKEFEDKNYQIEMGNMNITTELAENIVKIKIDRLFSIDNKGETRRIESFMSLMNSPLYNLAVVAQEIASQEARFCYFEYVGFMVFYPEFSITKKQLSQGLEASKIYIIEDRYSGRKLNIAIRSCAVPGGL